MNVTEEERNRTNADHDETSLQNIDGAEAMPFYLWVLVVETSLMEDVPTMIAPIVYGTFPEDWEVLSDI